MPTSYGSERRHVGIDALLVLSALALVFAGLTPEIYAVDDFFRIDGNPAIDAVWPPWRHFLDPTTNATAPGLVQYRPLLPLSFSLDVAVMGRSALAMHRISIAYAAVTGLLLLGLLRELLAHWTPGTLTPRQRDGLALLVVLLATVHPIAVFTTAYLSARDLLMAQGAVIATLWAYAHLRRCAPRIGSGRWWASWSIILVSFTVSMLSKQIGVVLPAVVLCFDLLVVGDDPRRAGPWVRAAALVSIVAGFVAWTHWVLDFSDATNALGGYPPLGYALIQGKVHLAHYLSLLVWPFPIRFFPAAPEPDVAQLWPWALATVGLLLATIFIAWRLRRRSPLLSFSVLAYWGLMALESSVLPFVNEVVHYRPYPALPWLFLAVTLGVTTMPWAGRIPAPRVVAVAVVLVTMVAARLTLRPWVTQEALWVHAVTHGVDSRGHTNLAVAIPDAKDPRVLEHLRLAAGGKQGLRLTMPDGAVTTNVDVDADALRDTTPASMHFARAAQLQRFGRRVEAQREIDAAAEAAPAILSYQLRALVQAEQGAEWARVLMLTERIEAIAPGQPGITFIAGTALQQLGRLDEALQRYLVFLTADSTRTSPQGRRNATRNLAIALAEQGRCREALPWVARAIAALPGDTYLDGFAASCR